MLKAANALLDRLFSIFSALLFCQIPTFIQQYMLKLSGHVDESKKMVSLLETNAERSHLSLDQYIEKFLGQSDPDFFQQGLFMKDVQSRYEYLSQSLAQLDAASSFSRPLIFVSNVDFEILKNTFSSYTIGFSFTIETIIWAFIGIIFGYLAYQLLQGSLLYVFKVKSRIE